jgi:hypothetical protein
MEEARIKIDKLEALAGPYKRAILDFKSTYDQSSFWDNNWKDPSLTGPRGFHNSAATAGKENWWETTFPGN